MIFQKYPIKSEMKSSMERIFSAEVVFFTFIKRNVMSLGKFQNLKFSLFSTNLVEKSKVLGKVQFLKLRILYHINITISKSIKDVHPDVAGP